MEDEIIDKNKQEYKIESNEDLIMKDTYSNPKKIEILDKMMNEKSFSDSEDEEQKDKNPKFILDEKNYNKEMSKINKLYEQNQ